MKCKECHYHENDEVCENECGRSQGLTKTNKEPCYDDRVRTEMSQDTCVYNCGFCRKNRKVKEG
jgi:hypothetical protein